MTANRILLINPPAYDFSAFDLWLRPLGLLQIGAMLNAAGHDVRLIDCLDRFHPYYRANGMSVPRSRRDGSGHFYRTRIAKPDIFRTIPRWFHRFGLPRGAIRDIAERWKSTGWEADAILVTSLFTYWPLGVSAAIDEIRPVFPTARVILGGLYATLCPEHATAHSGADEVVSGPGLTGVTSALFSPAVASSQPRVFADYSLYDHPIPHAAVTANIGCPYHCDYCASRKVSGAFRRRDISAVLADIDHAVSLGAAHIAFYDDAFLFRSEKTAIPLLSELIKANFPVRYHFPNGLHVRYLTPDIARLFFESNTMTIRLSFESVMETDAAGSSFKSTPDELVAAVAALKSARFDPSAIGVYVLTGLPGQEYAGVIETYRFIHENGLKIMPALFSPVPGTASFFHACEHGLPPGEPLLQNKIAYAYRYGTMGVDAFNDLRRTAATLNAALLQ